jgi:RHH-type transcriptional regulator, proline utilization regulon repressor / proline dehydrogenase / delta 1-pyrroline-5-carboxylate dehydrogenase
MSVNAPESVQTEIRPLFQKSVELAAEILKASRENESSEERSRSAMMARMMEDAEGKKFTIAMADQVLRIHRPGRAARRMEQLIEHLGIPRFLSGFNRFKLWIGNTFANFVPRLLMPLVKKQVRADSAHVIISAEPEEFQKYLAKRREDKIRVNFNQLGEAVLGDIEANRRLHDNISRLREPGVDYISIKLSSIVSQISLTGYQQTIDTIKPKLREIYRAAKEGDGQSGPKFVNLDMEEYRDLHLTVDVFQSVLDEPEFDDFEAGIVLQAYLPDSYSVLQSLTQWARKRYDRTGTGIKVRIVKGANLAMEQVEASIRHWQQAPFYTKLDVDANYKRMIEFAFRPQNAEVVRIGVASHNLFDIAFAMVLRQERRITNRVEFEMLEGMANAQAEEVRERTGGMLVYTPVVLDAEFESAVAYLVRRLDENTAPGSFLGALFALKEGTPQWDEQKKAFLQACERALDDRLPALPNRNQNRLTESPRQQDLSEPFQNVPDTDFSLPANRQWAEQIHSRWKDFKPEPVPLQIGGAMHADKLTGKGRDPSRVGYEAYRFAQADKTDIDNAIGVAVEAQKSWESMGVKGRAKVLSNAAVVFARRRDESIGAMLLDAGKNITEADVEVSEAIDFANYYARGLNDEGWHDGTAHAGCGVVVVTPPWNFPFAIPAGGALAALMAGCSVILKPARESVLVAWQVASQLWEAGVPKEVLQFTPTVDGETGKALVTDPRVNAVILTGSIYTAQRFQAWRPSLRLYAETSGKNSMIITAAADLDLAIKDLVRGAFGHSGQKCSATSLALIESEVYDNPRFMNQLKDAAESLVVGGSWNLSSSVTPVIREPDEDLMKGLTELSPGEKWLIEPKTIDDNPCLWRPGIRMDVQPGSWYHKTECFGPVLGLIRVKNFAEAIEIQNSSDFGLTGGLHSLDPHEIEIWREKVEVGNAYINRTTTGAVVQRQPFGGWKDSCVGPGPKAGGPNYVATFCDWTETALPEMVDIPEEQVANMASKLSALFDDAAKKRIAAALASYAHWWQTEFSMHHDPSQLHGETNDFRYRPRPWHLIRVKDLENPNVQLDIALCALACETVGSELYISSSDDSEWLHQLHDDCSIEVTVESDQQLVDRLASMRGGTMRIFGEYDEQQFAPAKIGNIPILPPKVLANGRIELLNYLKEQSISETVHRYGNIIFDD